MGTWRRPRSRREPVAAGLRRMVGKMPSAYVLIDNVPSLKGQLEGYLEEHREKIPARTPVRHGNFKLLVEVVGQDAHEVDHFITDDLRFAPGVYAIERVVDPETTSALSEAIEALHR